MTLGPKTSSLWPMNDGDTVRWWCDCGKKGTLTMENAAFMSVPPERLMQLHGVPLAGHVIHTEWVNPDLTDESME
jgi:hypothetical protein